MHAFCHRHPNNPRCRDHTAQHAAAAAEHQGEHSSGESDGHGGQVNPHIVSSGGSRPNNNIPNGRAVFVLSSMFY